MKAPSEPDPLGERDEYQWVDYGVNVGRNVIGDIHIHPILPVPGLPLFRPGPTPPLRQTAFRSALIALGNACEHAAAALSSTGPLRPERRSDESE